MNSQTILFIMFIAVIFGGIFLFACALVAERLRDVEDRLSQLPGVMTSTALPESFDSNRQKVTKP
jgi:hypothetical protein